jgi:hypothetical protein
MAFTNWTINNSNIQGDLNINLEMGRVYQKFVELNLLAFSSKFDKFDIAIEYRRNKNDQWHSDTKLITSHSDYIKTNKLFGLKSINSGYLNKIIWNYSKNHIKMGDNTDIRIKILPRIKHFSKSFNVNLETVAYSNNKSDLISKTSNYNVLGINNYGQYIAIKNSNLYILNSFDETPIYAYNGVLNPKHAIQIYSDEYIVADTDNDRILWLDSTLENVLKNYTVSKPQFIDYSESNETLLITSRDSDTIYEITWNQNISASVLWTSSVYLNNPSCATYSRHNADIIISDTDNGRVVIYNKLDSTYDFVSEFYIKDNDASFENIIEIYKPFRAYQLYDGQVCVIEKSGREIDFDFMPSISSSSSSYDDDLLLIEDEDEWIAEDGDGLLQE